MSYLILWDLFEYVSFLNFVASLRFLKPNNIYIKSDFFLFLAMTEVAAREEAKVKRGRGGGGGRGGRGGGGRVRGGRGTVITDCGHVMQRSEPEKREDGELES